jgi:hypothetical protein
MNKIDIGRDRRCDMATVIELEKSWRIHLVEESKNCVKKYKKWNPPKEGWFCRDTNKKCCKGSCPYKTEDLNKDASSSI